jgi:hypothetical protein
MKETPQFKFIYTLIEVLIIFTANNIIMLCFYMYIIDKNINYFLSMSLYILGTFFSILISIIIIDILDRN